MKLLSCYVEGFGNLKKREYTFDGLTVVTRENGAGKTTLASFIKALFYGLPSVRAGGNFNDRQRFCPFDGSKFGGNLVFEKGGDVYRIERFFDKKSETRDELTVYCNGRIIRADDIGKQIFGLDAQSFVRTAFVTSEITEGAGGAGKILSRDAGLADPADFDAAIAALDRRRKELKADRGKKGLIYEKKEEVETLRSEIAQLRERERALGARYEERGRLIEEISALERAKERETQNKVIGAKLAVLDGMRGDIAVKRAELAGINEQFPSGLPSFEELDTVAEKQTETVRLSALSEASAQKQGSGKARIAFLPLALLLIAAGAWLCTVSLAGIAVIALGAAAVAAFSYLTVKSKKSGGTDGGYSSEIARLDGEITEIFARYKMRKPQDISGAIRVLTQKRQLFEALSSEVCNLETRAKLYAEENGLSVAAERACSGEVDGELADKRRKLGVLDGVIGWEEADLELLPDKLSRLEIAEEELAALTRKHETVAAAEEFLKRADGRIKEEYVSPVRGRFEFYAREIKTALGDKIYMDADFAVSIEKNGSLMGEKYLSAGQRGVVNLCLRLALMDNMYAGEKPFIIMDDPFVNLDEKNFEGCKRVIRALSGQIQIIYFTCHESRAI